MQVVVATVTTALERALARPLEAAGHEVVRVRSGGELAARLAGQPRPSAAFVARRLPGGDALVLALAGDVPLVLVSADDADRDAAHGARLAGFLQVPFAPSEVLASLGVSTRTKRVVLLATSSASPDPSRAPPQDCIHLDAR